MKRERPLTCRADFFEEAMLMAQDAQERYVRHLRAGHPEVQDTVTEMERNYNVMRALLRGAYMQAEEDGMP
jgi:hypothetical protein